MNKFLEVAKAALGILLLLTQASHAAIVSVSFDATPALAYGPLTNAKVAFTYETRQDSMLADAILSFDITILDKTYTLDEIGFTNFQGEIGFGGKENDPNGLSSGTDDFMFIFDTRTNEVYGFSYSIASVRGSLYSFMGPRIPATVTIQSVPEPQSLALMLAGLAFGVGLARRTPPALRNGSTLPSGDQKI